MDGPNGFVGARLSITNIGNNDAHRCCWFVRVNLKPGMTRNVKTRCSGLAGERVHIWPSTAATKQSTVTGQQAQRGCVCTFRAGLMTATIRRRRTPRLCTRHCFKGRPGSQRCRASRQRATATGVCGRRYYGYTRTRDNKKQSRIEKTPTVLCGEVRGRRWAADRRTEEVRV